MIQGLGALLSKIDIRDYKIAAIMQEYPENYIIKDMPPVKNQGSISSCVAHATSTILEYFNKKEVGEYIQLSTNFIYGMQSIMFNRKEKGMYLRDACRIVKAKGNPWESIVSGNTEQPDCGEKLQQQLTDSIYQNAENQKVQSYARCNGASAIKYALMNYGPVLASVNWHNENYIDKNNVIQMDKSSSYGRHAIVIYGWNKHGWLCRNSWGEGFGEKGNFIYPYENNFNEAWSFVDAENNDIKKPKHNSYIWKIIYSFINLMLNLFKKQN